MATSYLSPGVYVEEVATGPRPIEGVSTSTAGFVGVTERGPLQRAMAFAHEERALRHALCGSAAVRSRTAVFDGTASR